MLSKLRKQMSWSGSYKDVAFKIVCWAYESSPERLDKWNYYIYLREKEVVNFSSIWLEEQKIKYCEASPERITYDYYSSPLASVEMHGGITYYEKHGYTEGHRIVEIGCDYMHLYDDETKWDTELLWFDVQKTIDNLYESGVLKPQIVGYVDNEKSDSDVQPAKD